MLRLGLLDPRPDENLERLLAAAVQAKDASAATFSVAFAGDMQTIAATHRVRGASMLGDLQRAAMDSGALQELDIEFSGGRVALAGIQVGDTPVGHLLMAPVRDPGGQLIGTLSLFYTWPLPASADRLALARQHTTMLEHHLATRRTGDNPSANPSDALPA